MLCAEPHPEQQHQPLLAHFPVDWQGAGKESQSKQVRTNQDKQYTLENRISSLWLMLQSASCLKEAEQH